MNNQLKENFIKYELTILTLKGALSTRDKKNPIYSEKPDKKDFKDTLRVKLKNLENDYKKSKNDADHLEYIKIFSLEISQSKKDSLYMGTFRFGVAQKVINLHLKYLWASGFIDTPPHCPIDGIIRDKTGISYDWTEDNDMTNYEKAIEQLKNIAAKSNLSLAEWELKEFKRRGQ